MKLVKKSGFVAMGWMLFGMGSTLLLYQSYFKAANHDFGKKHFIVGYPHETIRHASDGDKKQQVVSSKNKAFFAPDDDIATHIIQCIDEEKHMIQGAIYIFTHDAIAQALVRAHKRGIKIELIVDPHYKSDRYSKIIVLKRAGISVFEYDPSHVSDTRSNIMHNKFLIFGCDDSRDSDRFVVTGSYNYTRAANWRNQENAVILYDPAVIVQYREQFTRIKQQRCIRCSKTNMN